MAPFFRPLSETSGRCLGTYQGGGEDGEEHAEAEDDTIAGGLGEDGDAAEEAVRMGMGTVSRGPKFRENTGRVNRAKSEFAIATWQDAPENGCVRRCDWKITLEGGGGGGVRVCLPRLLDADASVVFEVLGEAGGAFSDTGQAVSVTGTGHGALNCGAMVGWRGGRA